MKYLFLLILFSGILLGAKAQKFDELYYSPTIKVYSGLVPLIDPVDSLSRIQYQLDYAHNCMFKYKREQVLGFAFTTMGVSAIGVALLNNHHYYGYDSNKNTSINTMVIGGGAIVTLLGIILMIDSEKWNKRAHIASNGLGVKYVF